MAVILSMDPTIAVPLLSTHGTATLLSRNGREVKVPLAPLLAGCTLVRSMVADSQLHPGIHGPLILSFTVNADILKSVGGILSVGESNVREENFEEVVQVLNSLGVVASLSQIKINNIEHEYAATSEENDNLEIEFEPISGEETHLSEGDINEDKVSSLKKCYVNLGEKFLCSVSSYNANKKGKEKTVNKRIHTDERPFTCEVCNLSFANSSNLRTHSRTHTGVKPYTCRICNSSFSQSCNLQSHVLIHTGEKPFKCKSCSYSSSRPSDLRKHNRIHTGEKPYTCKICSFSCSQPSGLTYHNRIHTREKPYTCKICGSSFSRPSSLRTHGKIHISEKNDSI